MSIFEAYALAYLVVTSARDAIDNPLLTPHHAHRVRGHSYVRHGANFGRSFRASRRLAGSGTRSIVSGVLNWLLARITTPPLVQPKYGNRPPTMTTLPPIGARPDSLTDIAYGMIRDAIVSRKLRPGERITENSLARQLSVSKTPVREALLQLEYIGLVEPDDRRGVRIAVPSSESLQAAYEVRMGLEVQAARIVAERADQTEVRNLRIVAESCLAAASAHDRDGFRDDDRRFHRALADATQNRQLSRFVHDAFDLTWALRTRDVPVAEDSLACAHQHLRIVDALEARSPEQADAFMRAHISKVQGLVLAAFLKNERLPN